jgi:1,4-dihydroxy-6-naphthoate synthase
VDRPTINFAFSSCPNDTFAFHALVHDLVGEIRVSPHIDDIEALNIRAAADDAEVTKVSIAAYGRGLRDRFVLLRAGGAAGYGVGPIVVAREKRDIGGRVAIPGERTTANLLLRLLGQFDTVAMRFDQIEDAVIRGDVDCGVLIHEGRFTYQKKGLTLLADLGTVWEERMNSPLPLAAIAIRRDLASTLAPMVDRALRLSVEYAFTHPDASRDYVAALAQDMDPDVARRHIDLYVNDYTVHLDEVSVRKMLAWGEAEGMFPPADTGLPLFV